MAEDQKISQLPEALTLAEDDYVPIVQASSGLNKKAKVSAFVPDLITQTITNGVTDKAPSEDAVFDALANKADLTDLYKLTNDFIPVTTSITLESSKMYVVYTLTEDILLTLPPHGINDTNNTIVIHKVDTTNIVTVAGYGITTYLTDADDSVIYMSNGSAWIPFSWRNNASANAYSDSLISQTITNGVTDKSPSEDAVFDALALKLDLSGGNANQDIDIGNFSLNTKHVKINGTGGAGHIGLKHQSADISASASESSIGADSVGDPVWKNDGGAIDKLELQSNKTSTVTGNEASITKYLTVKGVYDWAVGLFAPKASPTFTGTVTTPDIVVSNATGSTPAFFDAVDKLISTTAQLWGTWVQTWASKATPVDADTIGFYNSATTFVGVKSTLLNLWTTYLLPKVQALGYLTGTGLTANFLPKFTALGTLADSYTRQDYFAHATFVKGSASYTNAFTVTNVGETIFLFAAKNDGANVQMNSIAHQFGLLGPGQIIFSRSLTYSNLIFVRGTDTTSTNYIQGWINSAQTIYGFRYTNTLVALWQANDNTSSTILQKWSNASNVQIGVLQNDGLYFGTGTKSASAIFQLDTTDKGSIPYPRMTNAQRTALTVGPTTYGLIVYCTDATEGLWIYKSTGWTFII